MIQFFRLSETAQAPTRRHDTDAGFDLYWDSSNLTSIFPHQTRVLKTGIGFNIPKGMYGKIEDRSSLSTRGLIVSGGIIDSGYHGEVQVVVANVGNRAVTIESYERIAQIIFMRHESDELVEITPVGLPPTERGANGFGSTGKF